MSKTGRPEPRFGRSKGIGGVTGFAGGYLAPLRMVVHMVGPINETLVRDLATGTFIANQRNAVLIGGTGKTHLAIAIARSCIRAGLRDRFFNVVDLVNRLESETRVGKQGRNRWKARRVSASRAASPIT